MPGKPSESLALGKKDREVEQSQRTSPGRPHSAARLQPHEWLTVERAKRSHLAGGEMNVQAEDLLVVGDRASQVSDL